MAEPWVTEIDELHAFFEAYFLGTAPADDLRRFADVLDPTFTIVGPDGNVSDRAATIDAVGQGHAHTRDFTLTTRDHELVHADDTTVVAAYIEHHAWSDGRENERRSTVVFRVDDTKPNGLRWLRVHETWTAHD
ncbi:MAG: DUF4440 domain-containing protein [Actinomycetota bacterium]